MLTSFFGKSKPINFIIVSIYITIGYLYWSFTVQNESLTLPLFQKQVLLLLICFFTVFLLNFIVKKNHLTENNTYSIFFFACFMLLIPETLFQVDVIISNLFLLLAYRRILSLTSDKNIEKKILDASIWISVASLFNFWCVMFFIILFIAILLRGSNNYKLILIPFVGFLCIITLVTTYNIIFGNSFLWFLDIDTSLNLDYQFYNSLSLNISISILIILLIWTFIQKLINFSEARLKDKSNYILLILILLISTLLILLIPNKNSSEFLYIMAPLAIITSNFIEKLTVFWIKEWLLWIILTFPILVVFL